MKVKESKVHNESRSVENSRSVDSGSMRIGSRQDVGSPPGFKMEAKGTPRPSKKPQYYAKIIL